jgi:transposase
LVCTHDSLRGSNGDGSRRRATGDVTAHKSGDGPKPKLAAYDEALRAQVGRKVDITLVELQVGLPNEHAVRVSAGCLWARVCHLGLTLKKKSQRTAEQDRVDIAEAREQWRARQGEWPPQNLVFVDETCASTKMTRLYGRCPRGERLVAPVPWGHWKTTTFVGALRQDGLVAPCAFDGADERREVPRLDRAVPRSRAQAQRFVILDNLSSHKVEGATRTAIENAGASLRYLPAYSPDLNPIEQWFAKLKALLRKAAARTFNALIHAIAGPLETFTQQECANYLANSGYLRQ